jgi:ubiquinone/menaquinone biosynthesis C-methylase UbiE
VAPSNAAQEQAWDGAEGGLWAVHADLLEKVFERYDGPLLDAARIAAGARVLDVGCGTGSLTRAAARRAAPGPVLGVDLSATMIDVARARAAGLGNAGFVRADAQVHPFPDAGFDAVVSRAGASFFGDPPAAFANLARATAPGGRLALLTWQAPARNEWFVEITAAWPAAVRRAATRGPEPVRARRPRLVAPCSAARVRRRAGRRRPRAGRVRP